MTTKFNWRWAFNGSNHGIDANNRQRVVDAIYDWHGDWNVETESLWIMNVEDSDRDCIWNCDDHEIEEIDHRFSHRFIDYMDKKFLSKQKVVIGKATKLPLPVASPPSSSKGAVSSSSF